MKGKGGIDEVGCENRRKRRSRQCIGGRCKEKKKEMGGGDGGKRMPGQCIGAGVHATPMTVKYTP